MTIPILVEPVGGGFRASTGGPLDLAAEAATAADAVSALRTEIAGRLARGGMIVHLPVGPPAGGAGLADSPVFDDWLRAVADYRAAAEAEGA